MKIIIRIIFCFFFLLIALPKAYGKDPYCQNLGFELGDFTNWEGYTWSEGQPGTPIPTTPKVFGMQPNRQAVITTAGYDPVVGGTKLKTIPPGYATSARLGSTYLGLGGLRQSLTYALDVSKENAFLVYHFAVVLLDPHDADHQVIDEPRFKVTILDQSGNIIPDCANYDVFASDARIGSWQQTTYYVGSKATSLFWRDWTAVGVDLSKYIGQKITVEFMSANCRRAGHFGYAYLVAECQPLYISVKYCSNDVAAVLTAPTGFDKYSWKDSKGIEVGKAQELALANPEEGATYSCDMVSATGCPVSLTSKIIKYEPNADFKFDLVDCNVHTNSIKFANLHPPLNGYLEYKWDFGDGTQSNLPSPTHVYSTSGMHTVSLVVKNPPSTCFDSVSKQVETFNPPFVGITGDSTYCDKHPAILKAYGAHHYSWGKDAEVLSTADSLSVTKAGTYWMLGYSSNNCVTEKKYKTIKEEPDWEFAVSEANAYCEFDSLTMIASGAVKYKWSPTNKTTDRITVKTPGIYRVTGTNPRGCEKTIDINVLENKLPKVDFALSTPMLDRRHNQLTCTIPQEDGARYYWNFGDNEVYTESTSPISHTYADLSQIGKYSIHLRAKSLAGCEAFSSQQIEIVPFFPNVFTPNGDGVNDLLLEGLDISVFDRNGLVLYKGSTGWDGTYNGKNIDNDTYFYTANYTDINNQLHTKKGFVTLIR